MCIPLVNGLFYVSLRNRYSYNVQILYSLFYNKYIMRKHLTFRLYLRHNFYSQAATENKIKYYNYF